MRTMAKVRNTSKVKILLFNAWNSVYKANLALGWPLNLLQKITCTNPSARSSIELRKRAESGRRIEQISLEVTSI